MTTENPTAEAEDTPTAAPQEDAPTEPTFEFADTPTEGPDATGQEEAVPPEEPIFGKYTSMEEAERAYKEAERMAHERAEEAATYRKALETVQPTPAAQYPQPDQGQVDEQFRGHLEESPWQTLNMFVEHKWNELESRKSQTQSAMMQEYQKYASDPAFADVAPQVMQNLAMEQNPDVEKIFLRTKIAAMQNGATVKAASDAALGKRMHVESGSSRQPADTIRVEIDPEAKRMQKAFGMSDAEFQDLNRRTAMAKMSGKTGRAPVSIDEWRAAKGGGK